MLLPCANEEERVRRHSAVDQLLLWTSGNIVHLRRPGIRFENQRSGNTDDDCRVLYAACVFTEAGSQANAVGLPPWWTRL
jgi:hypothetical protein